MVVLDLLGLVSGDLARGLLYSLRLWVVCLSSVFEPGCCLVGNWFGLCGRLGGWSLFEWWVCVGLVGCLVRLGGILCLWLGFGCCLCGVACLRVLLMAFLL